MCSFVVFLCLSIPRLGYVTSSNSGADSHWEVLLSVYLHSCFEARSFSNLTFTVLSQPPECWAHRCARPGLAEMFLCFTVCMFSFLPYLSLKSPVSLLVGVCSQAGWSLVVDPQNKEKKGERRRGFLQDFLTIFLGDSFPYVWSFLSCLSPYPQDSIVSICLLKCNFRRVERFIMYASLQKYLV